MLNCSGPATKKSSAGLRAPQWGANNFRQFWRSSSKTRGVRLSLSFFSETSCSPFKPGVGRKVHNHFSLFFLSPGRKITFLSTFLRNFKNTFLFSFFPLRILFFTFLFSFFPRSERLLFFPTKDKKVTFR